ncbi:hypothetical protein D3C72_699230 [compost metagenome]
MPVIVVVFELAVVIAGGLGSVVDILVHAPEPEPAELAAIVTELLVVQISGPAFAGISTLIKTEAE